MNSTGNKTKLWALGGFVAIGLIIVQAMARRPDAKTATYATGPFEAVRPEADSDVEEDIDDDAPADSELAAEEEAAVDPLAAPDLATAQEHAAAAAAHAAAVTGAVPGDHPENEQAALNDIEWIKTIPGAAPLLDDVLEHMKAVGDGEFSLANLLRAENDRQSAPQDLSAAMIKDPDVRAKWDKLLALIANAHAQGAAADVKKQ